jgi:hypothetical protein
MLGDGDVCNLEAAASTLIVQHGALVKPHATDKDDLRHCVAMLEADLRRLHGSLAVAHHSAIDKVAFSPPPPPTGVGPDSISLPSPCGWPQL